MLAALELQKRRPNDAKLYAFNILSPYVWIGLLSMAGILPIHTIITFLTVPVAVGCSKTMMNSVEGGDHLTRDLGARTANLLHMFATLLAVAFAVARFI